MKVRLSLVYQGTPHILDSAVMEETKQDDGSEVTILYTNTLLTERQSVHITRPDGAQYSLQVKYLRYDYGRKEFPCVHVVKTKTLVDEYKEIA